MYVVFIITLILLSPLPFTSPFVYDDQDISVNRAYGVENNATQILSIAMVQDLFIYPVSSIRDNFDGFNTLSIPTNIVTVTLNDTVYALVAAFGDNGVQIINITDPSSPSAVSNIRDGSNGFDTLGEPFDITTVTVNDAVYALVTASADSGVQIINITDPSSPSAVYSIRDNFDGFNTLGSPTSITTVTLNDTVYALVTATDSGIQIINITDPSSPSAVYDIRDDSEDFDTLKGSFAITTVTLNDTVYALVAAFADSGIQIINITDPSSPSAVYSIRDNFDGFNTLGSPTSITTVTLNDTVYALVTASADNGIQIINITDPSSPSPVYDIRNDFDGFNTLYAPIDITTVTLNDTVYALVAASADSGIQIINITDPSSPSAVYDIRDDFVGFDTLKQLLAITPVTLNDTVYALVTHNYGIEIIRFESKEKALSINSNNTNPTYAKAGDTLTVKFTVNDTIDDGSATILDLDASSNFIDQNFTASITVPATEREGYANFRAVVKNNQTSSLVVTQNDLPARNIFIDTIPPTITLIGDANYTVFVGTTNPFIPGANVSDGDPNYSGIVNITTNGTLNTSKIGSVILYTYTADSDGAGNLGNTVSRTVHVQVASPSEIISNATQILSIAIVQDLFIYPVSSIRINSDGFGTLVIPTSITTVTLNDAVYALTTSYYDNSVQIINITDPSSPSAVYVIHDDSEGFDTLKGSLAITPVTLNDTVYALVAASTDNGVQIINITDPSSPSAVYGIHDDSDGFNTLGAPISITTVTLNDTVYALVTSAADNGVQIINITDPSSPSAVYGIRDDSEGFDTLKGSFAITTVTLNDTVYALVAASADSGVQIINITDPSSPSAVSSIRDNFDGFNTLSLPTSIITVTLNDTVYALVTSAGDHGVQIINITDPSSPSPVYDIRNDSDGFNTLEAPISITTVTLNDTVYALVAAFGEHGVQIINITDPSSPSAVYGIRDDFEGFDTLKQSLAITTVTLNDTVYALVTHNSGIEIIRFESKEKALSINSNNTNPAYARAGDTLTVKFTVNDTIDDGSATILDLDASSNFIDQNFTASITVPATELEGYANFRAVVKNNQTSSLVVTQNDLLARNIFIDTIPPTITLIGDANYTVFVGTTNPFIPGATVSDGDPNYSGIVNITTNGTLNTSKIGSVILYTYTADSDGAGNLGNTVSRTVHVQVASPSEIVSNATQILSIAIAPGLFLYPTSIILLGTAEYSLLNLRDITTVTVNDTVYALTISWRDHHVKIINITDPSSPSVVYTIRDEYTLRNDRDGFEIGAPNGITTVTLNDTVYALVAHSHGVQIINITDPSSPSYVYNIRDGNPGGFNTLRKSSAITTVTLNDTVYALVTASTDNGVQIINITDPSSPSAVSNIRDGSNGFDTLGEPFDITTVTVNDAVYALVGSFGDRGVQIINITDPSSPSAVSSIHNNAGNSIFLRNPAAITTVTLNDAVYALVTSLFQQTLQIINITDPSSPSAVSHIGRHYYGYNQATPLYGPIDITTVTLNDAVYALVANYYARGVQIINITDPSSPSVVHAIRDNSDGIDILDDIYAIATVTLNDTIYVVITSYQDDGFQIIKLESGQKILSLKSNNTNPAYARAGDTLTVKFKVNGTIDDGSATILDLDASSNFIDQNFTASITVPATELEGYANFRAVVKNNQTSSLVVTQNDLLARNIFIDTIPPTITLIGDANYTVFVGTTNPFIPGATVSDGDPNYSGIVNITTNGTLNTSKIGSVILYTYTVDSDGAGNTGDIISRIVTVAVFEPIPINSLTIASSSGTNYANAGKNITVTLVADGTDLVNFTGTLLGRQITTSEPTGGTATFTTTVQPGDDTENVTFSITVTNSSGNQIHISNANITDGSFVTIDTIKPIITLVGGPTTVLQGETYQDPGATISDENNASYVGLVSASSINTATLGAQNITYTGTADAADNEPDEKTRTITVLAKPLGLNSLIINSTNQINSSYAKDGDNVTVTLTANGTIGNVTVIIAGNPASYTFNNNIASATVTIDGNFADTDSTFFKFTVYNEDNLTSTVFTHAHLTGSNIAVDTTAPTITLNGPNPLNVSTANSFTDPGATASDASYDGDIQITGTGNVNTTITGPYTLSYKAPDDPAGNTGPTITRTLNVKNVPPINITSFTVTSTNPLNSSYATIGDTLSFNLRINYSISSHTAQILGVTPSSSPDGFNLNLSTIVSNNTIESNATFVITVTNNDGTSLTVTEDDLSTNIFVDTVSPRIELVGSKYHTLVQNSTVFIPSAIATDGDPNYSGTYNFISNTTLDTRVLGSVYNYTYTADDDSVGNPGNSVSQIITIIDSKPITITSLNIKSSSGTNYANAGKNITVTLVTDGTDLVNFIGTLLGRQITTSGPTGGTATFTTTVQPGDANENATFSITVTNSSGNQIRISNADITDGSFVTIDTIKPVIVLTGGAVSILQGDAYQEPGTAISDSGNASYAGSVSASSIDNTILGSQNITYTGTADAAGNVPDQKTRTITVLAKPLGLNSLTIESNNNVNTSYAKDGDAITVTLTTNGTIGNVTGVIANNSVTYTVNGNNASSTVTVDGNFVDTASVSFSITAYNEDNLTFTTFTNANLNGSNIAIDTTAPSITLNGANNTIVFTNSAYVDKNATASDVSYATDDVQVFGAGNVNTALVGNYTITYTAPDDPAGNTGPTITRNVIVQDAPSINITNFIITSDNSNTSYAKTGDTLILTLSVNDSITNYTGKILNTAPDNQTLGNNDSTFSQTLQVPTNATESYATFTATVENVNRTTLTVTENNLTGPNVFVDTIPPNITLIGPADSDIVLDSAYTDLGATASDGDPNYSGIVIITTNGTLNTSKIGSVILYTYTADSDGAGNLGSSTSRIVTVVEPEPITITSLNIASSSGNNYANANKTITLTLVTDGTDLGNFTGILLGRELVNDTNGSSAEFTTTVVSGDDGNATFSIALTNSSGNRISITNADITDGSFVTIDTIKPVIVLTGGAVSILQGDAYQESGTAISDSGNASYTGSVSASSIDNTILGSQNITYTGTADAAGNVPDQKTRTITVLAKPLGLNSLTIESNNNVNTSFAKDGDAITVTLTTNGTIGNVTGVIANNSVTYPVNGNNASSTVTVDGNFVDTASVSFSITAYNEDNLTFTTFTNANLNGSNIAIDTTAPSITLNGANNTIVFTNSAYVDKNATASDVSYATDDVQVFGAGNVNTALVGNYTITYTAPDDPAGNTGPTITRNVIVQDVPPINVNSLSITSSSGTNYANASKNIILTLVTDGSDLSNITGTLLGRSFTNTTNGGDAVFTATVVSGDDGNATFSIALTNSSGNQISITNADITDGSFVTIDTIKPVIVLTGGAVSVLQGDAYQEPGTTVSDENNTSYAGLVSASSIDTTILGPQNITYAGTADAAGNVPDQKIRTITVLAKPLGLNPLGLNPLVIDSTNQINSSYAKDGDNVTVTLTANGTIGNVTVTIAGNPASYTFNNNIASATVTIDGNFADTDSTFFEFTVYNEDNLTSTVFTHANLTGSNIAVDTTAPTITLNGPNPLNVSTANSFTDPGATASDASYDGDIQITGTGNVNTTITGSYTLSYKAPDDPAGNTGPTITRTLNVKNVPPIIITSFTVTSNNTLNTSYATIGDTLSFNLTVNYSISNHTVQILGETSLLAQINDLELYVDYNVPNNIIESYATFVITVTNNDGTSLTVTEDDLSTNIFVDTVGPRILLIGPEYYFILQNTSIPSIPNVTVTDEDPNYSGTFRVTTNGTLNTSVLGSTVLYTYTANPDGAGNTGDNTSRLVTVTDFEESTLSFIDGGIYGNDDSDGNDDSNGNAPTLGKASSGAQLVTNGFEYNNLAVNVGRYHTEFPLIGTNVGDINTIKIKIYDSVGPTGIKRVELALGVPDVGLYHEAEAFIEIWMQRDSIAVQEIIIEDKLNLLEDSDVSSTVSQISCTGDVQQCLLVELKYSYREPPVYNTVSIKPVDWDNNAHQFYFNDGIHVDGDSINLPKEIDISASHAANTMHATGALHLIQIDRAEHLWVDQYGYQWMIMGNTVRQITVPEYLVPNDNTFGTLHGPDRNHPEFASTIYAEQLKAQETLAEILGHATIIKPLPESGGTIYFDATGTDSRSGDSFKLVLELETARMQQLSNLLYDDTS